MRVPGSRAVGRRRSSLHRLSVPLPERRAPAARVVVEARLAGARQRLDERRGALHGLPAKVHLCLVAVTRVQVLDPPVGQQPVITHHVTERLARARIRLWMVDHVSHCQSPSRSLAKGDPYRLLRGRTCGRSPGRLGLSPGGCAPPRGSQVLPPPRSPPPTPPRRRPYPLA